VHPDAESFEFFLDRDEDAAVFPLPEGIVGCVQRLLLSLDCPDAPSPSGPELQPPTSLELLVG